ncbi:MAG: hypothetical protein L6R28_00050 [Planctomycetes bacterium]|nr:hypothetical protein [Planctomycetota bacterium]
MPAEYSIDTADRLVHSLAWGTLTDKDLLAHQLRLIADKEFRSDLNQIFDFREVSSSTVTFEGVKIFADRNPFGTGARRVFVVADGATTLHELLRRLEALLSGKGTQVRVQLNDIEAASRWIYTQPSVAPRVQ